MKKLAPTLLIVLALGLLPGVANASPGHPSWSNIADSWKSLWALLLEFPQYVWQEGGAMIDPVGQDDDEEGHTIAPADDADNIQNITAPGGPMIDPVGQAPPPPASPESATVPTEIEQYRQGS